MGATGDKSTKLFFLLETPNTFRFGSFLTPFGQMTIGFPVCYDSGLIFIAVFLFLVYYCLKYKHATFFWLFYFSLLLLRI